MAEKNSTRFGALKKWNPWIVAAVLLGVVTGGNIITIQASSVLRPFIRSVEGNEIIVSIFHNALAWSMSLSFIVPLIVMVFYIRPIFLKWTGDESPVSPLARKRILGAPLSLSLLSLLGWSLPIITFVISARSMGVSLPLRYYVRVVMENLTNGLICFVFCYNVLELYIRYSVIPVAFPDNHLSDARGALSPSIIQRFQMLFFATSFFPVLILFLFTYAHLVNAGETYLVQPLVIIVAVLLFVGSLINFMTARIFRKPLLEMSRLTGLVASGDFSGSVPVVSVDELGQLGEAMNEMTAGLKEREKIRDTFGKMVDPRVRDHLLAGNVKMGGELCEATILFSDIRGFTPMSEKLSPAAVVFLLNDYFEEMSRCIDEAGGVVNKYIGDAVMAIFGVPVPLQNPAQAALDAALAMRAARERLNERFREEGLPPIMNGIGIHSGEVLAGNIGSQNRMEYTVIGDAVNVAARIEKMCKKVKQDILLSEETVLKLEDASALRKLGSATLTGRESQTQIYSVPAPGSDVKS